MNATQGIEMVREELESHWLPFTDNKSFKDAGRNLTGPNSGTYLKPSIRNFWLSVS